MSDTGSAGPQRRDSRLLAAVRGLLRPLARLMLAHGITLPAVTELLKGVLVESAVQDFPGTGGRNTDSRISVLTGVHRKDVKRLRNRVADGMPMPRVLSLGSRVVNTWLTESEWQTNHGKPRVLAWQQKRASMPGFVDLVESVSTDVSPRAVLDELVRVGAVELLEGKRVRLSTDAFIPSKGFEEKLFYLERGGHAHLSAAVSNVEGDASPCFDRIVHYVTIPAAALAQLEEMVERDGMQFLQQINKEARQASNPEASDLHQVTAGIYLYITPVKNGDEE